MDFVWLDGDYLIQNQLISATQIIDEEYMRKQLRLITGSSCQQVFRKIYNYYGRHTTGLEDL